MHQREPLPGWQIALGVVADVVRVATLVLAVVAFFTWGVPEALLFLLVFALILVPRLTGLPRPFDAGFAITLLLATLAGVLGWYRAVFWSDLLIHFATTGATAVMVHLLLAQIGIVHGIRDRDTPHPDARIIVLTAAFGLSIGVLWEFLEWAANLIKPTVHVGYGDTLLDLVVDLLGSIVAGFLLLIWARSGDGSHGEHRNS